LSYQPGTMGSVKFCPPCRQLEPHTGIELGATHELGHPSTLHRPADGQFQLLKGAEEDHIISRSDDHDLVIRATAVGWILWGSPTLWTQVAGKEKLGTSKPT
jgi:hypothetical protein